MMDDDEPPALSNSRASSSSIGVMEETVVTTVPSTSSSAVPPLTAFVHSGAIAVAGNSGKSASGTVAPPSAAFAHSSMTTTTATTTTTNTSTGPSEDLNSRWKQYESEMDGRRNESSLAAVSRSVNDADEREATRRFMMMDRDNNASPAVPSAAAGQGGGTTISSSVLSSNNNNDNPDLAPRRVYSFNKSSSYDTNELIRKYSGVTGIHGTGLAGSTSGTPPPLPSPSGSSRGSVVNRHSTTTSAAAALVREEALQVLDLVDEHLNTPFSVRRTESGGFRAAPTMMENNHTTPYRVRRTDSGAVIVENDQEFDGNYDEDGDDDTGRGASSNRHQPYFVKRTASGTITSDRGSTGENGTTRRTPSALAGLSLAESATSRNSWRAGRYSFNDPKFREDSYIADEEDDIMRPVSVTSSRDEGDDADDDGTLEVVSTRLPPYRDSPTSPGGSGGFFGDYPTAGRSQPPSPWSSRYSTTDLPQKRILDRWDNDYASQQQRERQSARNMFMSTASNMRIAAGNVSETVVSQSARVFGAGFSFRQNHTFGHQQSQGGTNNLRTVWKDDDGAAAGEEGSIQGTRVHKTWQEVMLNKRKRRRVLMSLLCIALGSVIIGVAVGTTRDERETKKASTFAGSGLGSPVTFYVTSDTPYDRAEEDQLSKDLSQIPKDAEFILHLGNFQDAKVSMCPYSRNYDAASILKNAPVPLFVVPGEQDWVKCPNQGTAWNSWLDAFGTFQSNFDLPFEFQRSESHPELFSFLQNGVLFFGLHLVSGTIEDVEAHDALNEDLKTFFLGLINQHKDQFRAVVIMGNARPGPQQKVFFDSIRDALVRLPAPVAYVHANSGTGPVEYSPFEDIDMIGIQVPKGGDHPPMKINVGFGLRPFVVG